MPDEHYAFTPAARLMQVSEIEALSKIFVAAGVNKIRLTGGEPLVRKDAASIILTLSKLPVQLTLTTNGTRLHEFIDVLQDAGIHALNISLDTLNPDKFTLITRRPQFERVWKNIQLLLSLNFYVKVNVVVMKGLNDNEINDFIAWTKDAPVHVRFIEFMPFSGNRWTSNKVVTLEQILHTIAAQYDYIPLKGEPHDTAKKFIVPGHAGTFAVISTMSAHFCGDCNRMRLTADGKFKNCLFSKEETDLLTALRSGYDVMPLIRNSVADKAAQLGGQFNADLTDLEAGAIQNRSMISIGG
jgi:cyclic pyranopterin phosphate synthase